MLLKKWELCFLLWHLFIFTMIDNHVHIGTIIRQLMCQMFDPKPKPCVSADYYFLYQLNTSTALHCRTKFWANLKKSWKRNQHFVGFLYSWAVGFKPATKIPKSCYLNSHMLLHAKKRSFFFKRKSTRHWVSSQTKQQ